MKKILLHICCGPCAIYPVQSLQQQGLEVIGFYYNPNIHPLQEYLHRRQGTEQVAKRMGIQVIYKDDEYSPKQFLQKIAFRENNRCFLCYQTRLTRTFSIAKRGNFDFFSSTLLYSKFQKYDVIHNLAHDMAAGSKTDFWPEDFRPGWKQGIEQSKQWEIYRQQYCGCIYSEFERFQKDLIKK